MNNRMPTLFVSHGAPSLLVDQGPTFDFFNRLGGLFSRPKAILCVSAHWRLAQLAVTGNLQPSTIHDFYGFQNKLYEIQYPSPGNRPLAQMVQEMLIRAGLDCDIDESRGLDHGTWVPLKLMYPAADIPVIQLSLQTDLNSEYHFKIGQVLEPLSEQGVLILASGGATHNLRKFGRFEIDAPPQPYAKDFDSWLCEAIETADEDSLLKYQSKAPHATQNHPTAEHFLPLFVSLGAAGKGTKGKRLHHGFTYGILSMAAYGWGM
jgi:4,5-DOPA dioxygenase extradiol